MEGIKVKKLFILILMLLCVMFLAGSASAATPTNIGPIKKPPATINVNPGDSIQTKVDNANPGDILNLSSGTYNLTYDIHINKNLTITGPQTTGTPTAIIDGKQNTATFCIYSGASVKLEHLTIQNSKLNSNIDASGTGGIENLGNLTMEYCDVHNDTSGNYGAIYNIGTLTINNSNIHDNKYLGIYNQGNCTINNSNINNNGKGIYNTGTCTLNNSNINKNSEGIFSWKGTLIVNSCHINYNNVGDQYGGGIYNSHNICTITKSYIEYNRAGYGGGIYNDGTNQYPMTITGSCITNNTAEWCGGGINNHGTCTSINSYVINNTAWDGGGIYNCGTLTINGSNINNNTSNATTDYISDGGGGIFNTGSGNCTITKTTIKNNITSYNGGAIYNNQSNITVKDSNINNNTATKYGGGICNINGTLTLTGCYIKINTANIGGGIYNTGTSTVNSCDFELNKAVVYGNTIYNEVIDNSPCILHFNRFYKPSQYEVYSSSGNVDARYNWWSTNKNPINNINGAVNASSWLILKISPNLTIIGKGITSTITANLCYDSNGNYHNPLSGHVLNGILIKFTTSLGGITNSAFTSNGTAKVLLTGGSVGGIANVSDNLDNQIAIAKVTIDSTPPKISSTTPANLKTGIKRNSTITIKFTENIYNSTNYDIITVKNLTTGKKSTLTKTISGNILYIKNSCFLSPNTWYQVIMPIVAVKDKAGNKLNATCTFKFKTGT